MNRRQAFTLSFGALALVAAPAFAASALPRVQVYRSPSCGCCGAWVKHLQAAGFQVRTEMVDDPGVIRRRHGLADRYASCHTAVVAGYAVEGHVPAADLERLLALAPDAIGLAVPGMPVGSPGMEAGAQRDPYEVLVVDRSGRARVFASYR